VYKYGFEYIIICVYKLCDTVACRILMEVVNLMSQTYKLQLGNLRTECRVCEFIIVSDYRKAVAQREKLEGQLTENTAVKEVCDNYNSMEQSSWEPTSRLASQKRIPIIYGN
jgi:hypothetical protein